MAFIEKAMAVASKDYVNERTGMDLLWANASPTSAFAGQTISLNLSSYKTVAIVFINNVDKTGNYSRSDFFVDGKQYKASVVCGSVTTRSVIVSTTGITFETGNAVTTYGTETANTKVCVPVQIYGIK